MTFFFVARILQIYEILLTLPGTVLEERIRQLARLHRVESLSMKLKDLYNAKLNDQRLVAKEYKIRTEAAHGKWNLDKDDPKAKEDHKRIVSIMIKNTENFLRQNPA